MYKGDFDEKSPFIFLHKIVICFFCIFVEIMIIIFM